jgi:lipopolysaccharide export system protein LptA
MSLLPKILFLFFSLFYYHHGYALEKDKKQPIYFTAGVIEWEQLSHKGTFSHMVSFEQGSTKLYANHGNTQGDEHNQFNEVILFGDGKNQAHFLTLPKDNEKEVHAYADKMVYLPQKNLIQLYGNVYVTQGRYHFRAPYLQYNLEKKKLITQSSTTEKTTVIVDPEK